MKFVPTPIAFIIWGEFVSKIKGLHIKMDIHGLDTLVFSGGGVRGLAYVGALMAFEDTFKTSASKHFTTFAGSSVGALFAMLVSIGTDINTTVAQFEAIGLQSLFSKDLTWLISNFALNDSSAVRQLVLSILQSKGFDDTTTLLQMHAKTKKSVIIATVDLATASVLYLDHKNAPDMPVLVAIMGSMALPPMFPPVVHGPMILVDGGLLDNFPVTLFDPKKTLGLRTTWYVEATSPMADISAFYERILAIVQLPMHAMQMRVCSDFQNTVYIDVGPIKADNANADTKDLIFKGYRTASKRFSGHVNVECVEDPTKYIVTNRKLPAYVLYSKAKEKPLE